MTRISDSKTQLHAEMSVIWYYLYIEEESPMISPVGPEHFVAAPILGDVWREALELTIANQKVDLMALMRSNHEAYVAISDVMMPRVQSMVENAEKLMREGAAVHHAMEGAKAWLEEAEYNEDATPEELHASFGEVASRFQVGEDIEAERFGAITNAVISRFYDKDTDRGIPVPLIEDRVRHYRFGKFYLVGGLTSNHKTTFALQSVLHSANSGHGTLMWTLEDDNLDVGERMMVAQSDYMTLDHFERGTMPDDHIELSPDLVRLGTANKKLPIYQLDKRMTLTKMIAQISRMVYKHNIKMIVIDFLQLILRDDPRTQDTQHLTECAQSLADLAKRLGIVIIAVVQLTQDAARRAADNEAPRTGDVRGGSAIVQAAFGVIMCHRPAPDKTKPTLPEGLQRLQLAVRKWKRANLGILDCLVDAPHDRITRESGSERPSSPKFYPTD